MSSIQNIKQSITLGFYLVLRSFTLMLSLFWLPSITIPVSGHLGCDMCCLHYSGPGPGTSCRYRCATVHSRLPYSIVSLDSYTVHAIFKQHKGQNKWSIISAPMLHAHFLSQSTLLCTGKHHRHWYLQRPQRLHLCEFLLIFYLIC